MLCLGFSGGMNRVWENPFDLPGAFSHDGAAVLVEDGRVIAAIEDERLNRIKHSNKFPVDAIRFCLESRGVTVKDLDCIAFYATEAYCDSLLSGIYLSQSEVRHPLRARQIVHALFRQEFQIEVDVSRIRFVGHHLAHATSAFAMSGFEESLILVIDGYGDFLSGMVAHGKEAQVHEIETFAQKDSVGLLYLQIIQFIGYGPFEEYKAMGLAPYGNPAIYRDLLSSFYDLLPQGGYRLYLDRIVPALLKNITVRKKGQRFTKQHEDLAAALQEALERIVSHVLHHHRKSTALRKLCLAGGVAHNCTMNGSLLYSQVFDDIFVQPAAHDAGCALGAALVASHDLGQPSPRERLKHVYWGSDIGSASRIDYELNTWKEYLQFEHLTDAAGRAAELMAQGAVIGWIQGRSEFGPRALGNRSILADPRPAFNKERINTMVKKREGYRPFAPSVLEEDASEYFELPYTKSAFPFMIFVVRVREDKRALLAAVTHVDGSARVQTVARETNPLYWTVIKNFRNITGVPVLLNTSFNNNWEPIVNSAEDAITTFLTTGLDYLIIGPYLVKKNLVTPESLLTLRLKLLPYIQFVQTRSFVDHTKIETVCEIRSTYSVKVRKTISNELFNVLVRANDGGVIGDLLNNASINTQNHKALLVELSELWELRLLRFCPTAMNC